MDGDGRRLRRAAQPARRPGVAAPDAPGRAERAGRLLTARLASAREAPRPQARPGAAPASAAVLALAIHGGGSGLRALALLALARWLGAAGFGEYVSATTWAQALAAVAALGLPLAALALVPRYDVESPQRTAPFLRTASVAVLAAGAAAGALAVGTLVVSGHGGAHLALLVAVVPALALLQLQDGLARASGWTGLGLAPLHVAAPALLLVAASAAPFAGLEPDAGLALLVFALALALPAAVQARVLRRRIEARGRPSGTLRPRAVDGGIEWRSVARLAAPLLVTSMLALALAQGDVLVAGVLLSPSEVGTYAVAVRLGYLAGLPLLAVGATTTPRLARLYVEGDREAMQRLVRTASRWSLGGALVVAAVLVAGAPSLLRVLGADFEAAMPVLWVVLLGQLVQAATGPLEQVLQTTGHGRAAVPAFGLGVGALLLLTAVGASAGGTTGAAMGAAAGLATWNGLMLLAVRRRLGIRMLPL